MGPLCGHGTPSEHNFLIECIKALHVYSGIMIVVNKLMQLSRSHGINEEEGGGPMAAKGPKSFNTKKQLKNDNHFCVIL